MRDAIEFYKSDEYLAKGMDAIQKKFRCCGVLNYEDWHANKNFECMYSSRNPEKCDVPSSCCIYNEFQPDGATCGFKVLNAPPIPTSKYFRIQKQTNYKLKIPSDYIHTGGCLRRANEEVKNIGARMIAFAIFFVIIEGSSMAIQQHLLHRTFRKLPQSHRLPRGVRYNARPSIVKFYQHDSSSLSHGPGPSNMLVSTGAPNMFVRADSSGLSTRQEAAGLTEHIDTFGSGSSGLYVTHGALGIPNYPGSSKISGLPETFPNVEQPGPSGISKFRDYQLMQPGPSGMSRYSERSCRIQQQRSSRRCDSDESRIRVEYQSRCRKSVGQACYRKYTVKGKCPKTEKQEFPCKSKKSKFSRKTEQESLYEPDSSDSYTEFERLKYLKKNESEDFPRESNRLKAVRFLEPLPNSPLPLKYSKFTGAHVTASYPLHRIYRRPSASEIHSETSLTNFTNKPLFHDDSDKDEST